MKNFKLEELPFEPLPDDNLSKYATEALMTPFPNKNSVARLAMFKSALGHSVAPASNPDRPLVDSIYGNHLIYSSDNYKSKGNVILLERIDKELHGTITETTYIYYDTGSDKVEMETIPKYQRYYRFGYNIKSELDSMEVLQESTTPVYTRYTSNMDPRDGFIGYGKNIKFIYSCSKAVAEDAIVITKSLSEKLAINFMDEVEVIYSPEANILKDIYGYNDDYGIRHYRPFPRVGELCTKEIVLAVTDSNENSYLTIDTDITDSDNVKFVHGGARVEDIIIYSDTPIKNPYLEEIRLAQFNYIKKISNKLSYLYANDYYGARFSDNLNYKKMRYDALLNSNIRFGKITLKNKIYIKIKTINKRNATSGDKLTNRDGGKGTIGLVVPDEYLVTKSGEQVDMIVNATGVFNRENPAQLFEKEINALNRFLQKYLNTSFDTIDTKYENIINWIKLTKVNGLVEEIFKIVEVDKLYTKEDIVRFYSNEYIRLKYDSYNHSMDFLAFINLYKFTKEIEPSTGPEVIYFKGKPMSSRHVVGSSFYMTLENTVITQTNIRADGMTNVKGALSKKGPSKKRHQAKWGTVAAKLSDLGLSILLNYFKSEDRPLLNNTISILDDYLQGLGVKFIQKQK